jgi:predicted small lipoprotein YifL
MAETGNLAFGFRCASLGGVLKRHSRLFRLLPLLMAVLLAGSCGKKGPPLPPLRENVPPVAGIEVRMDGDRLMLSWPLAPYRSAAHVRAAGFRVYRALDKDKDAECPECPPRFQAAADISLDALADNRPSAVYTEVLETHGRYYFRVVPYLDDGSEVRPSEIITIDRGTD